MALQLAAVAIVSLLAHITSNAVFWVVAGVMAIFTGFYWYDRFVDNLGLTFGICFVLYGLNCFGVAYRRMFVRKNDLLAKDDN